METRFEKKAEEIQAKVGDFLYTDKNTYQIVQRKTPTFELFLVNVAGGFSMDAGQTFTHVNDLMAYYIKNFKNVTFVKSEDAVLTLKIGAM